LKEFVIQLMLQLFKNILICLIAIFCCSFSVKNEQQNSFFNSLKNIDYDQAYFEANEMESDSLKYYSLRLVDLISLKKKTERKAIVLIENESINLKIIKNLLNGYQYIQYDQTHLIEAYKHFSIALKLSEEAEINEAKIFTLVAILHLLKNEIFIGSTQYEFYLNYLKDIKSDTTDDILYTIYLLAISSKEDENVEPSKEYERKLFVLDSVFEKVPENNPYKARYFFEKGIQYKLKKSLKKALLNFKKTTSLCTDIPFHKELRVKANWQISNTYYLLNKNDSAQFYLKKTKEISKSLTDDFYNERLQAWIFYKEKDFSSAFETLDNSINMEYRLGAKSNTLESSILAVENETNKLKLDKLRLDNRRKTNQNYLILAIATLMIGGISAFFIHQNTTKKRKLAEQEALLEQQKVETLLKEHELVSIDAMIAGQEKERQKVANELHDDLGSLMATVKLHFDNVKVDEKDPALKNAQKLLDEAYQKIRGMAHAKNSGVMANQGLLPAVKKMAKTINKTNALKVTVEDFGLAERMENSLELTIFRIIQELVANIIKHAEASKANIQFTQHESNLNIIVEDDGKGFDISAVKHSANGMGIGTIEKRIEHLEGTFTVDSILGKGTSILIDIPV